MRGSGSIHGGMRYRVSSHELRVNMRLCNRIKRRRDVRVLRSMERYRAFISAVYTGFPYIRDVTGNVSEIRVGVN